MPNLRTDDGPRKLRAIWLGPKGATLPFEWTYVQWSVVIAALVLTPFILGPIVWLLTGDVAHHPCQMRRLDWSSTADFDPIQSVVARERLFARFADTPTLVFGGHFDPGRLVQDGDAYRLVPEPPSA